MKRVIISLALLSLFACKNEAPSTPAKAEAPSWAATVAQLDGLGEAGVEVKTPGAADFAPWRGGQPIPAGSVVRTPATVRATLSVPHGGAITLNHSTTVELAEQARLALSAGEAVLEYPAGGHDDVTVVLPTGEVILHGTKVALVAGEKDSSVTVSQGLVEVRHGGESFEGRAGQEIILPREGAPVLTQSLDLGRRIGWSELGESEDNAALPDVPRGLGKLVGKTPGGEREHRLDLVNHRVDVKIQGNLAYTEITESFKNPTGETLEGVYRFPLPGDARISRLSLKVGDKWMEGEFLETAHAERIWRDVIEQWRDPAMLKWKEGNTFELRIFPINARETRVVKIGYVQRLEPTAGGYNYTYPMPVDRAGLIPAANFEFEGEIYGHDATRPLEVGGYAATIEAAATNDDRAFAKIRFSERDFVARGDFDVRFGRSDATGLRTYTYADPRGGDPFAVFVVRPEIPARPQIRPRDFVVIVDQSLSRTGAALDVQRRLVPRLVREMDPLDRVTVVSCSTACSPVGTAGFEPARSTTADGVQSALLDVKAAGASYPVEAVRVAADLFRRRAEKDREAHVIYFTDGVASAGELRPGKLAEAARRVLEPFSARMSVVDVGGASDSLVLEALATAGHGRVVSLDPMLSATGQALDILSSHYREVLIDPVLDLPPGVVAAGGLPRAIALGDELVIAARFRGNVSGELALRGRMSGSEFAARYPVTLQPAPARGNTFLPGEWAAQRIAALELDPGDHKREIVNLSKTYGVLSRYTTLLALESKDMMDEFGVRERQRTQWTADESAVAAEDSGAEAEPAFDGPAKGAGRSASPAAPRPSTKASSAPSSAPRPMADSKSANKKSMDLGDMLMMDDVDRFERRPMPRRHYYRPRIPVATVRAAQPPTSSERDQVKSAQQKLDKDPTNRSKRMSLIRAHIAADDLGAALAETRRWLDVNPMDPEALVQAAQIEGQQGKLGDFYNGLVGAADAAPRGRWLQERIRAAADAIGDEAMTCAFDVALEATAKRPPKSPIDILACPMLTHVGTWFGEPGPQPVSVPASEPKRKGAAFITLRSSSGGDWDLALLEPGGRPLWWGSARRNLSTQNVIGGDRSEALSLPSLQKGTYSVRAIPRKPASANETLEVTIYASGKTEKYRVAVAGQPVELAEITYR